MENTIRFYSTGYRQQQQKNAEAEKGHSISRQDKGIKYTLKMAALSKLDYYTWTTVCIEIES